MSIKIIKALVNGVIQDIEVEVMTSPESLPSPEERLDIIEDKKDEYYTKVEIDEKIDTLELITPDDIDNICNTDIQYVNANEVTF